MVKLNSHKWTKKENTCQHKKPATETVAHNDCYHCSYTEWSFFFKKKNCKLIGFTNKRGLSLSFET